MSAQAFTLGFSRSPALFAGLMTDDKQTLALGLRRRDPDVLDQTLAHIRTQYNTVRLHAAIGYVTPDDEHHGRGPQIRRARAAGMRRARSERIKQNRASKS